MKEHFLLRSRHWTNTFDIWANTFWYSDKYILIFGQIHFDIYTNKFPISGEGASSPGTEALPTAIDRDPPLSDLVSGRPQNKNLIFKLFILLQFQITLLIAIQGLLQLLVLNQYYWCVLSLSELCIYIRMLTNRNSNGNQLSWAINWMHVCTI